MIPYLFWKLVTFSLRPIPTRVTYSVAATIAGTIYLCWTEKRRNTIENMRCVLPNTDEATIRRVAINSWRNYGMYLVDFLRAADGRADELANSIEFDGQSSIEEAFSNDKGVLMVLMHQGYWDIGGIYFARLGYPLNAVAETFENKQLNTLVVGAREASGIKVIPMERAGMRILRALRRNEALAILMDRPLEDGGITVRFFGRETTLPDGAARLALRTGATVIAAAVVRTGGPGSRLRGLIQANITVTRTGNEREDIRALTEAFLRPHERFIRTYPEQWYMFRRMWTPVRRRPQPADKSAQPAR
jgi:lauroyl/myristoyl acyltransferase